MSVSENTSEEKKTNPHDAVVRFVLGELEHARELLGLLLPDDVLGWFDPATVRIENPVTFTRRGEERTLDLLISVQGGEMAGGRSRRLLVVLEHKSSHDKKTAGQVFEYLLRVRDRYPDQWLLPVLLYHGRKLQFTHPLEPEDAFAGMPDAVARLMGDHALRVGFRILLLNSHEQWLQQDVRGLGIEPLIYILPRIWNLTESDVGHLMAVGSRLGFAARKSAMGPVMDYIMTVRPDYNWERLKEIEARVIADGEDGIMTGLKTWEEELQDRGRQEEKSEIAENMLRIGIDDQSVMDCTGLSVESVADLKRTLNGAG